jgi:hypothetical protein
LTVGGLYDLLRDHRRRIVLPYTLLTQISELHSTLVSLFDAVGGLSSDPRWKEAADVLAAARELVQRAAAEKPLERARGAFEGARLEVKRKGMAMVRRVAAQRLR